MTVPVPKLNRRRLLAGLAALTGGGLATAMAAAAPAGIETARLRGALDATNVGLSAGTLDDQSRVFATLVENAAASGQPVFLPPGTYAVSNIRLPPRIVITGVPGATRLLYGGDGHLLLAEDADHVELSGLILDGANRWIDDDAQALGAFRRVRHLVVDNCRIIGSGGNGLSLEGVAGRIERCAISGAMEAGIYAVESRGLAITGNTVSDCANGGILVHRWQAGEDRTIVTGNRVERIGARRGGTGQWGNGINGFRADGLIIANNSVSDCAFSAIRANSCGNLQVTGNTCLRSGETGLYAEFSFEGAVISCNVVDGAANGVSVVNFDQGGRLASVTGNVVRNLATTGPYPADPPGFGVGITVEADTALSGNVVESAPLYGIKLGWGPFLRNVTATGNIVRNAGIGIAVSVVEGSGLAVVTDNVIDSAPGGAVVGFRWSDAVTGDLTSADAQRFAHLAVERNRAG
jgi:uncharacterized secreted repeat protein (TIGR03808 family)